MNDAAAKMRIGRSRHWAIMLVVAISDRLRGIGPLKHCLALAMIMLSVHSIVHAQQPEPIPLPPIEMEPALEFEALPPIVIVDPSKTPKKFGWSGSVELGLNGADGNSEVFKLRTATNLKFESPEETWTADSTYNNAKTRGVETEDRALGKVRDEWNFVDSPWSLFDQGELEYDAFKSYDLRLDDHGGVGYMLFKDDVTKLKARLGAGASQKFGGPTDGTTPEALAGLDFERKFGDRQKFTLTGEFYADVNDWRQYRTEAKIAYELLIDPVWRLTLKLGADDRFDSQSDGKKPNDIEYFAVLLWKF